MYGAGAELKFSSRSTQVQFRPAEAPLCFHFATLDLNFIVVACITMSEFPLASRSVTRAASKHNYAAQPVTAVAALRDKLEKPRGHIKAKSVKDNDTDDDSFADLPMAPAFPNT